MVRRLVSFLSFFGFGLFFGGTFAVSFFGGVEVGYPRWCKASPEEAALSPGEDIGKAMSGRQGIFMSYFSGS